MQRIVRLEAWVGEHSHAPNGGPWEVYWTDPGQNPDRIPTPPPGAQPVK